MKKIVFAFFLPCITLTSTAQTSGTLKGKLVDTTAKQSLKDASITILDPKDSTLELFGLAKADGSFEILNISFGSYLVHISFQGYEPVYKEITLSKTAADKNLGNVYMRQVFNDLGNVTVTQSAIVIKKRYDRIQCFEFQDQAQFSGGRPDQKIPGNGC